MSLQSKLDSDFLYKIFLLVSLLLLLINAWHAPMSGDEYVHVEQAEKNINYFKTYGNDKEALQTPISRLKHYGQSFDNITTLIAQILSIDNLYRFRHLCNSIMAWLVIVFTSLTAIHLTKSNATGILAVFLLLISARFMGHAMNNLKDIPFAFCFIFSIYFMFRFLNKLPLFSWKDIGLIILGLAFGISIRIGGLLIYAYFLLFSVLWIYFLVQKGELELKLNWSLKFFGILVLILISSHFIGIVFWPWAWEAPLSNPLASLEMMKNYPTTVRQIFEGKLFWSNQFPWYYLSKYMLITLPVLSLLGLAGFFIFRLKSPKSLVQSIFLLIAFGFPLFYAAVTGANVYGGWRQMLFVYPPLIVLSAIGLSNVYSKLKNRRVMRIIYLSVLVLFSVYPIYYSIVNYPYQYTFFNLLQGGFKGAYGEYELDYYFTSYKKAYEFIEQQSVIKPEIVAANFIIPEYYEGKPYKSKLIDYYNRSAENWDYAVICNTFLHPYQLKHEIWPPENTVYHVEIEGKPILAVLKRGSKEDYDGIQSLKMGEFSEAIIKLENALFNDPGNESILINLARAYFRNGNLESTQKTLSKLFDVYPDNEWAMDLQGELFMNQNEYQKAISMFEKVLTNNYKFFHSYVNLAKAQYVDGNEDEAINSLKKCLRINPFYEPAYHYYGKLLIENGDEELGRKMLEYRVEGNSKYGKQ